MELNLHLKTDKKGENNSKNSFSTVIITIVISVTIIVGILAYCKYNFNIIIEKESVAINAVNNNTLQN